MFIVSCGVFNCYSTCYNVPLVKATSFRVAIVVYTTSEGKVTVIVYSTSEGNVLLRGYYRIPLMKAKRYCMTVIAYSAGESNVLLRGYYFIYNW